jgi:hypothetical protein
MKIQDLLAPFDEEQQEYLSSPNNSSSNSEHVPGSEDENVYNDSTKAHNPNNKFKKIQKPNLTNSERQKIYDLLNQSSFNGKLPRGMLTEMSLRFKVRPRTISRIWIQGKKSVASGKEVNVSSRIKLKSGRKKNSVHPKSRIKKGYEGVKRVKSIKINC